jgi:Ethanolamine utilization protein EutJ (predicted chaperonin)
MTSGVAAEAGTGCVTSIRLQDAILVEKGGGTAGRSSDGKEARCAAGADEAGGVLIGLILSRTGGRLREVYTG